MLRPAQVVARRSATSGKGGDLSVSDDTDARAPGIGKEDIGAVHGHAEEGDQSRVRGGPLREGCGISRSRRGACPKKRVKKPAAEWGGAGGPSTKGVVGRGRCRPAPGASGW